MVPISDNNLQERIFNAIGIYGNYNHMTTMMMTMTMIIVIELMVLFVAFIACVTICKWLNGSTIRNSSVAYKFSTIRMFNLFDLFEFGHTRKGAKDSFLFMWVAGNG